MGMSIEEAIKNYEEMKKGWCLINPDPLFDFTIDILRKYQKIEDIYYHQTGKALEDSLRVVIEGGEVE